MPKLSFLSKQVDQVSYYYMNLTATAQGPLTIVCGGWERCRPDYLIQRRTFRYHSIEFVAEGRGELRLEGRRSALVPGIAFSYGPGIPHRIRTNRAQPMTKYFIDFTGREAAALIQATALKHGAVQVSDPYRVRALFDDIQQQALGMAAHHEAICRLLLQLLALTIDSLGSRTPHHHSHAASSYEHCKRCINQQFMTLRTLDDIARACHLEPSTICRLFKRFGDRSPYRYLMHRKMQHAAERLQSEGLLIKQLAVDMGFDDPYHFSRAFKRVHGIAPQRLLQITRRTDGNRMEKN